MLGLYAIPKAQPAHLMYAWDGVVVAFLFFWTHRPDHRVAAIRPVVALEVHALAGLGQRRVPDQLLQLALAAEPDHLPPGDARVSALALVVVKGIAMLPVLLLVAAFLLMVTALTYQFQGWLAALMSNPRRRRTVIMVATADLRFDRAVAQLVQLSVAVGAAAAQRRGDVGGGGPGIGRS